MSLRILITGPSGMGKTTLAKWLAEEYKIPFTSVSMIRDICKCSDVRNHQDIIEVGKNNPTAHLMLQWELIVERYSKFCENQLKGFVTDRGHIDSLVYTSSQTYSSNPSDFNKFINLAHKMKELFEYVIFIPYTPGWKVEDDGKRVANEKFQSDISDTFLYYYKLLGYHTHNKSLILREHHFEKRKEKVCDFINKF